MTDDIKLPPLPSPFGIVDPMGSGEKIYTIKDMGDYARAYATAAIKADRQQRGGELVERPDEYAYFSDWYAKDAPDESGVSALHMARHAWLEGIRFADLFPAAPQPAKPAEPRSEFEDPSVQQVYEIICGDNHPPAGEHWDGYVSRLIVDALFPSEAVKPPSDDEIREVFLANGFTTKPSDSEIMWEWANTKNTEDMRVDLVVFARALLARYGSKS